MKYAGSIVYRTCGGMKPIWCNSVTKLGNKVNEGLLGDRDIYSEETFPLTSKG